MKKAYASPEIMKISINSTEAFSNYTQNCIPAYGSTNVGADCHELQGTVAYGEPFTYEDCLAVGYPT